MNESTLNQMAACFFSNQAEIKSSPTTRLKDLILSILWVISVQVFFSRSRDSFRAQVELRDAQDKQGEEDEEEASMKCQHATTAN